MRVFHHFVCVPLCCACLTAFHRTPGRGRVRPSSSCAGGACVANGVCVCGVCRTHQDSCSGCPVNSFSPRRQQRPTPQMSSSRDSPQMARYRDTCPIDCKVYVGELGNSGTKHELEEAFGYYGPLRNVWVARSPPGFAFVEFEDPRDARDATRALDGKSPIGKRGRSGSKSPSRRDTRNGSLD
ncbi:hypothetical protein HPB48_009528 [Haemaphysalis longicornis]|uniref:RRM domain-containing protein n=1 Tax=Haemaphysalis longicornis TaxID=44386 RepID=A0A9J6GE87_HAELO|nr:hypothetical protein HPB48_009528 [Haemaphysalis longicornis]